MVGIVILNYNNAGYTLNCIESILRFNTAPIRIVVVDNASVDDSLSVLRSWQNAHPGTFELLVSSENGAKYV